MRRFLAIVYVFIAIVGFTAVNQASVSAEAYLSGKSISSGGVIYKFAGIDTRSNSALFGWNIYLPSGFKCGDKILVDNPKNAGTVATRSTTVTSGEGSPVIGDCRTNASTEVKDTLVTVTSQSQCTIASGIWIGSVCSFDGKGFSLPLESGRCYALSSGTYSIVNCPAAGGAAAPNCSIANTPPIPGFYTIDCTTGRTVTVSQSGDTLCGGTSDVDCMQPDGRYRCWDGSTIAVARGSTCPLNALAIKKSTCENSNGVWDAGLQGCTCASPLSLNGDVCVTPDNVTAGVDAAGTGQPEKITVDCEDTVLTRENCGIINIIVIGINFLSAIAGIVFVLSIMIAGFQYMTARDNAGQVQKARNRIVMTLVALGIYIFMYALLNFLVPGGVLPS